MNIDFQCISNGQENVNCDCRLSKFQPANTTALIIHKVGKILLT